MAFFATLLQNNGEQMNRRLWMWTAAAAALVGVAGCQQIAKETMRSITLSQGELQGLLDRQFPQTRRVYEIFDVRMSQPKVRLLPGVGADRGRLGTDLALEASERITGRRAGGNLSLDYGLRYEPSDGTVRLTNVRVNDAKLELGSQVLSGQTARLGGLLAERLLDDFEVYRFPAERLNALKKFGFNTANIAVTSSGVEMKFKE
jgi:hypothetical protein